MTITTGNLISLKTYSACRKQFQPGLSAHRRRRTVMLGDHMCVQFEDEMTLRYQIQEMLRAECIDDNAAIQHEIDTYAHLMPDGANWKATLLLQYPDAMQRLRELPRLANAARHMYIKAEGYMPVYAITNEDIGEGANGGDTRLSAVHFLRFQFSPALCSALLGGVDVVLGCDHPRYTISTAIVAHTLDSLRGDLARVERDVNAGEKISVVPTPERISV